MPRSRNRSPVTARASDKSLAIKVGVAAVGLLLIVGLLGWAQYLSRQKYVPLDLKAGDPKATLCPTDRPISGITAVLLDVSDPLSPAGRLDLTNRLDRMRDEIPRFGLLEVYVLKPEDGSVATPLLSLCNPGKGSDMNQLIENPELAKKLWQERFNEPIDHFLSAVVTESGTDSSPIFEMIKAISLVSFGRPERDGVKKNLIVVSDLIQNTPGKYSQYHDDLDFSKFEQSGFYESISPDLRNVHVSVLYLRRPTERSIQTGRHIAFWTKFFAARDAIVDSVESIGAE